MFDFQAHNREFIKAIKFTNNPMNDAKSYGVQIHPANNVEQGEMYWRVIGIHHLLPEENVGNHHVYIDALDENGNRVRPPAWVGWTWEGRRPTERADPAIIDKPANEPGTNIAMHFGMNVSIWMNGNVPEKSDGVSGLSIAHPDEPLPDGRLLNTIGHHSFYVVYQLTRKGSVDTPELPPVVAPTMEERMTDVEARLKKLEGKFKGLLTKTNAIQKSLGAFNS